MMSQHFVAMATPCSIYPSNQCFVFEFIHSYSLDTDTDTDTG